MTTFEQAFANTERAADAAIKAANDLLSVAKQIKKAAQAGNIQALRRNIERLENTSTLARQEISNTRSSWPFTEESEEEYLRQDYEAELLSFASEKDLKISRRDNRIICFPSIIRVLPSDKAIRIDRKKISNIRPTALISALKINQQKPNNFRSDAFLEALHKVYQTLESKDRQGKFADENQGGSVIPLAQIYGLFTSLPGSTREYDQTDFARDIYFLDSSGVNKTRSGARISYPASTGTRSSRGTFTFVSLEGEVVNYYGVQFTGGSS